MTAYEYVWAFLGSLDDARREAMVNGDTYDGYQWLSAVARYQEVHNVPVM